MEPIKYGKNGKRKKGGIGELVLTIVLCIVSLVALTGCLVLLIENYRLRGETQAVMADIATSGSIETVSDANIEPVMGSSVAAADLFTQEEATQMAEELSLQAADEAADAVLQSLKQQLLEGEDFSAILRGMYQDELVVAAEGAYHFFPILDSLAKHSYDKERFVLDENNILTYTDESGKVLSRKGIDVSRYQGEIDWSKVAADGVEFAMIRLGIRGSAEGTLVLDEQYVNNVEGSLANGIDTGVYFFTQALNEAEAVEEAEFVLANLDGYNINYPVAFDIEAIETSDPRTRDMTQEDWTKVTVAFCERIKAAGYTPVVYGNLRTFLLMLDMEQLEQYEKWFGYFRTPMYFPYAHGIWQYSSQGTVDGIDGDVDLNIELKAPAAPAE